MSLIAHFQEPGTPSTTWYANQHTFHAAVSIPHQRRYAREHPNTCQNVAHIVQATPLAAAHCLHPARTKPAFSSPATSTHVMMPCYHGPSHWETFDWAVFPTPFTTTACSSCYSWWIDGDTIAAAVVEALSQCALGLVWGECFL